MIQLNSSDWNIQMYISYSEALVHGIVRGSLLLSAFGKLPQTRQGYCLVTVADTN